MTVPQLTLSVLTGSLSHVLVPLLAGENEKQFNQGAWGFFLLIGGIFNILAVGLYVFAPYWVPLLVPGFSDEGKTLTRDLTRILLIGMIFAALAGVLRVVHYARQRFLWAEVSQLVETAVGFSVLIWALPKFGIKAAAWVT
ncbi:MAG: lipid II flippase MurJ, partial [Candidatus Binatia bacterium]